MKLGITHKKVTVKDKILNLMRDGRERTSCEISERVEVKKNNVRTLLYMLKTEGKMTCEPLQDAISAWQITEEGKAQ
tara:strand:+ start:34417 stop:34647 length:231 start_codon:yes stop_codon:yes gene_type:complete